MVKANLTSEQRAKAYRLLFQLNRSFHLIVRRLSEARALDMITALDARDMIGLAQEIQLEINLAVWDRLQQFEENDFCQFGKVRTALEKRLKDKNKAS